MRKSELSRKQIQESLVACLGKYGVQQTTFQVVADHCGVSQALVVKAYGNRDAMIQSALLGLVEEAKAITANRVQAEGAAEKLRQYAAVSLEVFSYRKQTPALYVLLNYLASYDDKYRELNGKVKEFAVERVRLILEQGVANGEFAPGMDLAAKAKGFHSALTGILLNSATEKSAYVLSELVHAFCEDFLRAVRK